MTTKRTESKKSSVDIMFFDKRIAKKKTHVSSLSNTTNRKIKTTTKKQPKLSDIVSPSKMQELLMSYTLEEIGQIYGYTRQNVHRLFTLYQNRGEISKKFFKQPIATAYKNNYNLNIISFNKDTKKVLVSIGEEYPKWYNTYKSTLGIFFSWGTSRTGRLKRYKVYLKDFEILQPDKWVELDHSYRLGFVVGDKGQPHHYITYENKDVKIQLKILEEDLFQVKILENNGKHKIFGLGDTLYYGNSFSLAIKSIEKEIGKIEVPERFQKYKEDKTKA